jgi:carboxybiotin decarboxylase
MRSLLIILLGCVVGLQAATKVHLPVVPEPLRTDGSYQTVLLPGDYQVADRLVHGYNAQAPHTNQTIPSLDLLPEKVGQLAPELQAWTTILLEYREALADEGLDHSDLAHGFPMFTHQAQDKHGTSYSTNVHVLYLPAMVHKDTMVRYLTNAYAEMGYHDPIKPMLRKEEGLTLGKGLWKILSSSGLAQLTFGNYVMISIAMLLLYLGIAKGFEPLLLIPIATGCIMVNAAGAGMINPPGPSGTDGGILYYFFSYGIETGIFPLLIFLGVGSLTDFGPLLSNPWSALLGGAAQFGIFGTFFAAAIIGEATGIFTLQECGAIAIIGGADGPTSIFVAARLAPDLLGAIAVAAYSYMALVPIIQPPIMKALTNDDERKIMMEQRKPVSKTARILFPISVIVICLLTLPEAVPLIGMLMFGNLLRECGVAERLSKAAQNELINLVTIALGLSVGTKLAAEAFLDLRTLLIVVLGCMAFMVGTATGVLMAKGMNKATGGKINPLIGSAGVSAVPMAARVSQNVGASYNKQNFLLMHAMGPNVAGVIGSAVAAGILLALLGS